MQALRIAACAAALAAVASAQVDFTFTLAQSSSNFTWSGTTSLGAIVGNPSNAFQTAGTNVLALSPSSAQSVGTLAFNGGDFAVVPDIHGKIPNPIPFLPPLATVDVTNLHLTPSSLASPVAAGGAFTALGTTMTALSGTMTVTQLVGGTTVTDLTGSSSTPSDASGTLTQSGTSLHLALPVNSTFPFSDPTSGVSGSITIVGTLHADWVQPAPTIYCTAKVNSQGCTPQIGWSGSASYSNATAFRLTASQVLNNKSGVAFYGFTPAALPFQGGKLCVQPPVKRTQVQASGGNPPPSDCSGAYSLDFNLYVQSGVDPALVPDRVVYAQYWARDPQASFGTSLSNALAFTLGP
jgi:hypothetical protein